MLSSATIVGQCIHPHLFRKKSPSVWMVERGREKRGKGEKADFPKREKRRDTLQASEREISPREQVLRKGTQKGRHPHNIDFFFSRKGKHEMGLTISNVADKINGNPRLDKIKVTFEIKGVVKIFSDGSFVLLSDEASVKENVLTFQGRQVCSIFQDGSIMDLPTI